MGCQLQVENTRNSNHSLEEIEKDEAGKRYHLLTTTAQSIDKEIEQLRADEKEINRKLDPIYRLESLIKRKSNSVKSIERTIAKEKQTSKNSIPGVIYLTGIDAKKPIRPDQKRCQKRLINKGRMDMEYLQQVEEQLLSSKKKGGMTSCGTRELNDLMNSMAQRIQHGSKNRKEEMKIHAKLKDLKITREMYTAPEPAYYDPWRSEYWEKRREESQRRYKQSLKPLLKNEIFELEIKKKDRMVYKTKVMRLEEKLHHVKKYIISLRKELDDVNSERTIICNQLIQMLNKQGRLPEKDQHLYDYLMKVGRGFSKLSV